MALADQLIEKLPEGSILRSLTRSELDDFLDFAVVKRLGRNETLIEAGDPGDSMMIVLTGTLKVCVDASSGREVVLDYLGPGGIIGEIAVFDGKPRTANVIAIENAELVVLQRRVVLPFLENHPAASLRVIEMLCDKLRRRVPAAHCVRSSRVHRSIGSSDNMPRMGSRNLPGTTSPFNKAPNDP